MEWLLPILDAVLGSLVRAGLTMLTGFLLERHLVSKEIADQFVSDGVARVLIAVPAVLALAWSVWVKIRGRARFLTALQSPPGTTEDQVKDKVDRGMGVSVKAGAVLLACLLGIGSMPACSQNPPTKVAALADSATKVQQSANVIFHATEAASAIVVPSTGRPLVSEQQLITVALVVNKVGHLGVDLAHALQDYTAATKAGKDLTLIRAVAQKAIADLEGAMADIGKAIPPGLIRTIDQAVTDIFFAINLVKGGLGL